VSKHHFDPGPTGIETHCHAKVPSSLPPFAKMCGHPLRSPAKVHFLPEEACVGCLTGYDIGLPSSDVAYPHPECPVHSEHEPEPLSQEQEEAMAAGAHCWCGGQVGPREPGDEDGLGCLDNINHVWTFPRDWPEEARPLYEGATDG